MCTNKCLWYWKINKYFFIISSRLNKLFILCHSCNNFNINSYSFWHFLQYLGLDVVPYTLKIQPVEVCVLQLHVLPTVVVAVLAPYHRLILPLRVYQCTRVVEMVWHLETFLAADPVAKSSIQTFKTKKIKLLR